MPQKILIFPAKNRGYGREVFLTKSYNQDKQQESNYRLTLVAKNISMKLIYLAEDDEDDRELFTSAMSEIFPETIVNTSNDGLHLLNALSNKALPLPEAIFLDINMPLMNGFDCIRNLKSIDKYKTLPVVVLSTSAMQADIDFMYSAGAAYYLVKPDSYHELKSLLFDIINNIEKGNVRFYKS